jgi:hypothetical protein
MLVKMDLCQQKINFKASQVKKITNNLRKVGVRSVTAFTLSVRDCYLLMFA